MGKIDIEFRSHCRQCSIGCVEQIICGNIIYRSKPFAFEYAPQCLGDVQMRAVWRKKKEEQTTFLPYRPKFLEQLSPMYARIVKNHKRFFLDTHGHPVKEIRDLVGSDAFICEKTFIAVIAVNHAKDIESVSSLGRDKDILTAELPSVRHISLGADMTFISKVKVYKSVCCLTFEFLQLLGLVLIELWRGFPLGTFSYTSISCANADKKALNVLSLTFLPDACSHASLAFFMLCLSCSMALRTASSSEQSIIGLRPRPGRVSNPVIPSASKRFTHALTDMCVIFVCNPTSVDFNPCDFKSIARQRIRYAWLLPLRKPSSNCIRCWSVSSITLIFAIVVSFYGCNTKVHIFLI